MGLMWLMSLNLHWGAPAVEEGDPLYGQWCGVTWLCVDLSDALTVDPVIYGRSGAEQVVVPAAMFPVSAPWWLWRRRSSCIRSEAAVGVRWHLEKKHDTHQQRAALFFLSAREAAADHVTSELLQHFRRDCRNKNLEWHKRQFLSHVDRSMCTNIKKKNIFFLHDSSLILPWNLDRKTW